jgi:hypothetical protein
LHAASSFLEKVLFDVLEKNVKWDFFLELDANSTKNINFEIHDPGWHQFVDKVLTAEIWSAKDFLIILQHCRTWILEFLRFASEFLEIGTHAEIFFDKFQKE